MNQVVNLVKMSPEARLDAVKAIAKAFKDRAYTHDVAGTFPLENYADLRAANFPALTIPQSFGGAGISLEEMLRLQSEIAKQDGSTGLAIGWHMGISKHLGESDNWNPALYAEFAESVIANGSLINNAASEPATGSPTRGGRPETTAVKTEKGWML